MKKAKQHLQADAYHGSFAQRKSLANAASPFSHVDLDFRKILRKRV